jgi:hypothetical protein
MGKQKRPTPEQIIMKLREAEVIIAKVTRLPLQLVRSV